MQDSAYFVALGFVLEYQQELLPEREAVCLHQCGAGLPNVCCWEADGQGSALALCYPRNKPFGVWTSILRSATQRWMKVPAQVHVSSAACWVALSSLSQGNQDNELKVSEKATPTSSACSLPMLNPVFKKISLPIFCLFFSVCVYVSLKIYAHSQMPNKEYFS